jgi:glucokinase
VAQLFGGIDLGGTKIQVAVLEGTEVRGKARILTPQTGAADVVKGIVSTLGAAAAEAGVSVSDLGGLGIGSPGTVVDGVVSRSGNIKGFELSFDLGKAIARATRLERVVVDNDVRVAMLGEHRAGAGKPYSDILGVFLGTGVGGGLVLGGELRHGRGAAGEIGHTVVEPGGRICSCGRQGCLEAYAGRGRIEAQARLWMEEGQPTILFSVMQKRGRDKLTSGTIADAVDKGDRMARRLVRDAAEALGVALANAQNLLDLEAIIIGGGLGDRLGKSFLNRVAAQMRPHLFVADRPPALLSTGLGDLSGAVGAGLLVAETPPA